MKLTCYKLSQYEIIQNDFGDMWWELHTAFGEIKRGKCFIKGDILILGAGKFEEPGFLMLEYQERLSRLPIWEKTKYYCQNPSIYSCKTNKSVGILTVITTQSDKSEDATAKDSLSTSQKQSFKLGNYEINEKPDGTTRWKTFAGYSRIKQGNCFITEDILFIEPGETEYTKYLKKDFLNHLKQLPQWDRTHFFCAHVTLHPCISETGKRKKYHKNYASRESVFDRNAAKQRTSLKKNFMAADDRQQVMNSALRLSMAIMKVVFFLFEFLINLLIELIGIKKR